MSQQAPLRWRTIRLDVDPHPERWATPGPLWSEPSMTMAAIGPTISFPLESGPPAHRARQLTEHLRGLDGTDEVGHPGTVPVAFIAAPFAPGHAATALIPRVLVGTDHDATHWLTVLGSGDEVDEMVLPAPPGDSPPGPASFTVRPARDPQSWCAAVDELRQRIQAGELTKAVLAREIVVEADQPIPAGPVIRRLAASFPSCMRWHVDGFVGASPELLVSVRGSSVTSHPLAGTAARSGDPAADARLAAGLLASEKNRWEHQITIDAVLDTLLPYCSYLDTEAEPSVVAVANVQHLGTRVRGRLSSPAPSAAELAFDLHPTPAVGGEPRSSALEVIAALEGMDRRRYAGPVGWVDGSGDGTFAVGIRSAEIDGTIARVYAGNGVVNDSDPDAELEETRAKLSALLGAIVRP